MDPTRPREMDMWSIDTSPSVHALDGGGPLSMRESIDSQQDCENLLIKPTPSSSLGQAKNKLILVGAPVLPYGLLARETFHV